MADLQRMIAELTAQRDQLTTAIDALQKVAGGTRHPAAAETSVVSRTGASVTDDSIPKKRTLSPAARKKIAEAAKRRWAAQRKAAKSS